MQIQFPPPLSHHFQLCGFTVSCFPFAGSLCCVMFLIFRAWQAEKCDLGPSNRLRSLGTTACTDANTRQALVTRGILHSSKANKPLCFASPSSHRTMQCKRGLFFGLKMYFLQSTLLVSDKRWTPFGIEELKKFSFADQNINNIKGVYRWKDWQYEGWTMLFTCSCALLNREKYPAMNQRTDREEQRAWQDKTKLP